MARLEKATELGRVELAEGGRGQLHRWQKGVDPRARARRQLRLQEGGVRLQPVRLRVRVRRAACTARLWTP